MTRPLFFLTALAAMLMAMTAILIRWELAYPGVSALFANADGTPNAQLFNRTSGFHSAISYLTAMLLGTTLCAEARRKGSGLAIVPLLLGLLLSVLVIAGLVLTFFPTEPTVGTGTGWVLYPPLSTETSNLLHKVLGALGIDPFSVVGVSHYLLLPAGVMLLLGCYAMVGTLDGNRLALLMGLMLAAITTAVIVAEARLGTGRLPLGSFHTMTFPLILLLAIHLIDRATPWVMMLMIGLIATSLGHFAYITTIRPLGFNDGMETIVPLYTFPLGIGWFALPAHVLFVREPRLPDWAAPAMAAALTVSLSLWLLPLVGLGRMGQPRLYVDYPQAFAPQNLVLSAAVFIFAALYLTLIVIARRAPR